jgi:glutathione S-transferase
VIMLYERRLCPWATVVRTALDALGLPYETIQVPATLSDRHEVAALSGQRLTPVIVDGDRVVSDSRDIVRYLQETYGGEERAPAAQPTAACRLDRAA